MASLKRICSLDNEKAVSLDIAFDSSAGVRDRNQRNNNVEVHSEELNLMHKEKVMTEADEIIKCLDTSMEEKILRTREIPGTGGSGKNVLNVLFDMNTTRLAEVILKLPLFYALRLLHYLPGWATSPNQVEIVATISFLLVKTYKKQLIATPDGIISLTLLYSTLIPALENLQDIMGCNLVGLQNVAKQLKF